MHYSRCPAAALGAAKKFPVQVVVVDAWVEGRFLGFVLAVRQAVADLMLAASDVIVDLGDSRRRRNTSGSH